MRIVTEGSTEQTVDCAASCKYAKTCALHRPRSRTRALTLPNLKASTVPPTLDFPFHVDVRIECLDYQPAEGMENDAPEGS